MTHKIRFMPMVLLALSVTLAASPKLAAQDCVDYSEYLQYEGDWIDGVDTAVSGDLCVSIQYGGLQTWDLSDFREPLLLGTFSDGSYGYLSVALSGHFALVADYSYGLRVVNCINPATPHLIGGVPIAEPQAVAAQDGLAYVVTSANQILIYDINSNPAVPTFMGAWQGPVALKAPSIRGNRLYAAADANRSFYVIDVTDPTDPVLVEQVPTAHNHTGVVDVVGDVAYVGCLGLEIIDVSDLAAPVMLSYTHTYPGVWALDILGTQVIFAGGELARLVDVSDPSNPIVRANLPGAATSLGFLSGGSFLQTGGYLYSLRNGQQAIPDGVLEPALSAGYLHAVGDVMVHVSDAQVTTLDLSSPAGPVVLDSFPLPAAPSGSDVAGASLLVGLGSFGIQVVDLTDPADLSYVTSYPPPAGASEVLDLDVEGSVLRVVTPFGTSTVPHPVLHLYDIADVITPVYEGSYQPVVPPGTYAYNVHGVELMESYAWISTAIIEATSVVHEQTILLDISDPTSPVELTQIPDFESECYVRNGSTVYATNGNGLNVIDFSDPASPQVGMLVEGAIAETLPMLVLDGTVAYVGGGTFGVEIFDLAIPASPAYLGAVNVSGDVHDMTMANGLLYVSDNVSGLAWVRPQCASGVVAPAMVTVNYGPDGNTVGWSMPGKSIAYFRVYRGDAADFQPSPTSLVQETTESSWLDLAGNYGHHYLVSAVDASGGESVPTAPSEVTGVRDVARPLGISLLGNVPNPFNPKTTIRFELPAERSVDLTVFDASGAVVRELLVGASYGAGRHGADWDGRDQGGRSVPTGVYFYRLTAGTDEAIGRMVLLK